MLRVDVGRLGVAHQAFPPWPLAPGAAGSSLIAASSSRRWSSSVSSLESTRPATETAMSAVFSQISARAWSRAAPMSRWARCLADSASAWACLTICSPVVWASCLRLLEQAAHLVGGAGHLLAVLGQEALALVAGPLGLVQDVLEVLLALVQGVQQRLPGELGQDRSSPTKTTRVQIARVGSAFMGLAESSAACSAFAAAAAAAWPGVASAAFGCASCAAEPMPGEHERGRKNPDRRGPGEWTLHGS